jgi:ribosomal protein S18 acetylase RimI-like enzyme
MLNCITSFYDAMNTLIADYNNPKHSRDILRLLNEYACGPMGGKQPLSDFTLEHLIRTLANMPSAWSILCYIDDQPAGLANCFEGFSTFLCKPLINIHDIVVSENYRGLGISQQLLSAIEKLAIDKGCCKMTLEVLEGNDIAKNAYRKFGFTHYELDPSAGKALFWEKPLNTQALS